MDLNMEKEYFSSQMVRYSKDGGRMAKSMDKVN